MTNAFDPEMIVVGGGVGDLGELLLVSGSGSRAEDWPSPQAATAFGSLPPGWGTEPAWSGAR